MSQVIDIIDKNPITLLYTNNRKNTGPGKVVYNLEKGFDLLNIVHSYKQSNLFGMLQLIPNWPEYKKLSNNIVLGPNLFVIPSEYPELCKSFNHFIVPSKWVHDLYREFHELEHASIDIWPVGIDTEYWNSSAHHRHASKTSYTPPRCVHSQKGYLGIPYEQDAPERLLGGLKGMIYFKSRSYNDLDMAKKLIVACGAKLETVVTYGTYTEYQLREICDKVDFAILLTGTESQGIAYMEIMSCGIPCYVFNKPYWDYDGKHSHRVSASSVPYFDRNKCGIILEPTEKVSVSHFKEEFLDKLDTFDPRSYIIENFGLEKQAQLYYSILEKYQK